LFAARKVLDATSGGLRRHLEQLSISSEAFLAKRRTYAYSLAATCAAGYVVGLGDRHLDNFLLSGDGALVHIDLGYSFGTGALLPVPELIPFRLTRELEAPLEPVGARRVLTAHLETALRTLRQPRARAPLLGLLEAFVREPVLDWLRGAKHAAQLDRDADDVEAGAAATPERRVATARGKLFGANPCHLLNREVAGNPSLDATDASRARHVVAGQEGTAREALRHRATLNVEDQVRVLVEMATDPASLGRHWCGLTLWV
jgi:DNA-dependent protein kinase catalytic subunit